MNIFITSFILYELLRPWIRISILAAETGKHHTDLTWLNSYHTEVHQVHQVMHTKFSITKLTNQFTGQRVGHSGKHGDSYFRVNPCQPLWTNPSKLNLYFQFLHFPKIYDFPAAEEKTCLASTCLSSATNANWFMASKGLSAGIPGWSTWKDGSNQANCCGLDFHHPQLSDPLVVSYLRLYDRFQKNILSAMVIAVENPHEQRLFGGNSMSRSTIVFVSGRWPSNSTSNISKNHEISMILGLWYRTVFGWYFTAIFFHVSRINFILYAWWC